MDIDIKIKKSSIIKVIKTCKKICLVIDAFLNNHNYKNSIIKKKYK